MTRGKRAGCLLLLLLNALVGIAFFLHRVSGELFMLVLLVSALISGARYKRWSPLDESEQHSPNESQTPSDRAGSAD